MRQLILIVDDSNSIRLAVRTVLQESGYDIMEASDGQEGIDKLDGRKYHLIISDYNMPRVNGLEFVAACRQLQKYKFTPIIMLTSESDDEKKQAAKHHGVKIWLKKPFINEILLNTVSKIILP